MAHGRELAQKCKAHGQTKKGSFLPASVAKPQDHESDAQEGERGEKALRQQRKIVKHGQWFQGEQCQAEQEKFGMLTQEHMDKKAASECKPQALQTDHEPYIGPNLVASGDEEIEERIVVNVPGESAADKGIGIDLVHGRTEQQTDELDEKYAHNTVPKIPIAEDQRHAES